MMQPPRHLDPSLLKQAQPLKPYLDNYLPHNTPEMQKDAAALGSFSNFPLSMLTTGIVFQSHVLICGLFRLLLFFYVEFHPVFNFRVTSFLLSLPPPVPPGLNSNLNVSLDMGGGSGGGALSYKEPPQSKLKKLWATDPLEQNSKTGKLFVCLS